MNKWNVITGQDNGYRNNRVYKTRSAAGQDGWPGKSSHLVQNTDFFNTLTFPG
jgi:hypothetical protein